MNNQWPISACLTEPAVLHTLALSQCSSAEFNALSMKEDFLWRGQATSSTLCRSKTSCTTLTSPQQFPCNFNSLELSPSLQKLSYIWTAAPLRKSLEKDYSLALVLFANREISTWKSGLWNLLLNQLRIRVLDDVRCGRRKLFLSWF